MPMKKEKKYAGKKGKGLSEYLSAAKKARINISEIQTTGEYMEMHYFSQKQAPAEPSLIEANFFFADFA
jgi:hypothetical protein